MNWVMGKALPDDVPIEAKMVNKAIERAQTTVEQRNGEIRKNVLKYDEVMNEQRKIIYKRRDQILAGFDLREEALEYLATAVDTMIKAHCVSEFSEEWDASGLVGEIATYWPSTITEASVRACGRTDGVYDLLMAEAVAHYEAREIEFGTYESADGKELLVMREVERQVMLQIIDQRWREHLHEMDYLQEGINLRAMGQKDPLVEWQREGFDMFGQMMAGIAMDFVRYALQVQVQVANQPAMESAVTNVEYSAPDDTIGNDGIMAAAQSALASGDLEGEDAAAIVARMQAERAAAESSEDNGGKVVPRTERRRLEREAAKQAKKK
jgi:preprotein translocase subunit SecA